MRKGNFLAIVFILLSVLIIVASVYMYRGMDKIAPEFRFSALDITYNDETTERDLLQGIKAFDAKDGDVSDRIVIEKVVANEEAGTAVVYYAVSDMSGNVTKQSRIFPAEFKTDEEKMFLGETFEDNSGIEISFDEMSSEFGGSNEGTEATSGASVGE